MKDDNLEKEFEEYFKGVNTPDNITEDAKKYVKRKSTFLPKFVKFASVAASFVLVFVTAFLIIFKTADAPAPPDSAGSSVDNAQISTYADSDLNFVQSPDINVGGSDSDDSPAAPDDGASSGKPSNRKNALKFLNYLKYSGANVTNYTAGYMNGNVALVTADVNLINGLSRHDTKVYVEFTDKNVVYSPLKDYADGAEGSYKGVKYYLTVETAENGEPVNKLYFYYNDVKYYFYVTSVDENAYKKYLELVIK